MNQTTTPLEPVDLARCQAETVERTPWALGGTHRVTRCPNQPSLVATEKHAGKDGQRGAMSLCADCKAVLLKQAGEDFATFEPIPAKLTS